MWSVILSALGILAPIFIKIVAYFLDLFAVSDEKKKSFYNAVAAWEQKRGKNVALHASGARQLQAIRDQIAAENAQKNGQ